jgi:SAM-dependent methyltransferase
MSNDRRRWEKRYADRLQAGDGPPPTDPSSAFLRAHADSIRGSVLEIAAGAGRNALFLARRGHRVDAIDISFRALRAVRVAAAREHLRLNVVQADLESYLLPTGLYDAVINIRYLQRSLFGPMQRALRPGGLILFETFVDAPGATGHPHNPAFLLRPGELRSAFPECDILTYEEGTFRTEKGEATLARLLGKRRPQLRD